jgi:hypothetical protein
MVEIDFFRDRYVVTPEHENLNGTTLTCYVENNMYDTEACIEGNRIIDLTNLLIFIPTDIRSVLDTVEEIQALMDAVISVSMYTFNHTDVESVCQDILVTFEANALLHDKFVGMQFDCFKMMEFVSLTAKYVNLEYNEVLAGWKDMGLVIVEVLLNE